MAAAVAQTPVGEALSAATDALRAAGVETPRLDAEVMLADASGIDRAMLAADPEGPLDPAAGREFAARVRRRTRREPVAYILGRKGFRGIEVGVDPRVLIPRPETELLVEMALEVRPASVLEVGTGSGAVALAVADELPDARVVAMDTSAEALAAACANAERLGLADRVFFAEGSLPADGSAGPGFDLLLANLPYVSEGEWATLAPEIREFEPRAALVPGPTGLEAIESVLGALAARESQPPVAAFEVGAGQAQEAEKLMAGAGYARTEARPDLAGIPRVVVGWRS
jgi:release factor glutamine methyltransferase